MPDPLHFDRLAEVYDRFRPPYPAALWERLDELGLVAPGTRVVDLGAGSGQASGPLVRAGAEVTAVEPGPRLAALLRARVPGARVVEQTAEAADLGTGSFDLVVVATALHWLDLDVLVPRLHDALVPGGHVAVWRHAFGDATAPRTSFREEVDRIVADRGDVAARVDQDGVDTGLWEAWLCGSGLFEPVHVEHLRWSVDLDAEQVTGLFTTFSDWSVGEAERAGEAVRTLGGVVTDHWVTPLLVVRRR